MPYMIYQQYITAIKEAYAGDDSVPEMAAKAEATRQWLSSLKIEPKLRYSLIEPIAAVEEAFKDLMKDDQQRRFDGAPGLIIEN